MPKKHNIAYVKPEEPSFLRKLKEQIGYKEGPTVDTKRENLEAANEEDFRDIDEEQPQVVVLRPGDLTADEAAREKLRLEKEEESKPADLSAKIVFKKPIKKESDSLKRCLDSKEEEDIEKKSKKLKNKSLLSFGEEEEDED
ncbi:hypothetical protein ABEB36_001332 [Hypothenemus hampei]|uniref:DUF4604 domain-containing protein n=1 Tax=Hypothenemus hampei TaxID=57062 RepID=A0ABD1FE78_HYPHA